MRLSSLVRLDHHAKRFGEILGVLGKYGLADWVQGLNYDWLQRRLISADGQQLKGLSQEARIRMALTELGTTFIKVGQILSTRADLIGPELATELKELQSNTPADSADLVRATIESELGAPVEELFAEFSDEALASASIGQVHLATLKDGTPVIVKVQHHGIEDVVRQDMEIMAGLAELAERHATQLKSYQPVATTTEFRRTLSAELDFTREKRNLDRFALNFKSDDRIRIPRAFDDLCSKRVLTMEFLEGIAISNRDALLASGEDLADVAFRGANMYLDMIFRDAFYHADPHPGNLMLLPEGVIGVIDCGMVGRIDEELRDDFEGMLLAAVNQDEQELTDFIMRIGSVPPQCDRNALRVEIGEFLADYGSQSIGDFDLSGALMAMTGIIRRYEIMLPSSCSMLLRVLVMLEGTSRQLDPDFSLAELLQPYYKQAAKRRLSPKKLMRRAYRTMRDWERLIDAFPRDASEIMDRVRQGSFEVNLQHQRLDTIVNRMVMGILTAALMVASALLWASNAPPRLWDVSVFGAVGFCISLAMGIHLFRAVVQSGSLRSRD